MIFNMVAAGGGEQEMVFTTTFLYGIKSVFDLPTLHTKYYTQITFSTPGTYYVSGGGFFSPTNNTASAFYLSPIEPGPSFNGKSVSPLTTDINKFKWDKRVNGDESNERFGLWHRGKLTVKEANATLAFRILLDGYAATSDSDGGVVIRVLGPASVTFLSSPYFFEY